MIERAAIVPTGDEVKNGVVLDTDSPLVLQTLLALSPACLVWRVPPVSDRQEEIAAQIRSCAGEGADLIVLIGGSGGGHRFSDTLGKDYTHSGMEQVLSGVYATSLYGKNGHLWSRLICGFLGGALVINVPGPYREAEAAMAAFQTAYEQSGPDARAINTAIARAVERQYFGPGYGAGEGR